MKRFLDYNKNLKDRTKELRENMTQPEKKLRFEFFKKLGKQKDIKFPLSKDEVLKSPLSRGCPKDGGLKNDFRVYKQRQIDNFIVDFYIPKLKLVIEINGESHFDEQGKSYDRERTAILEGLGLKVIRFTNDEIMKNFEGVCEVLEKEFEKV